MTTYSLEPTLMLMGKSVLCLLLLLGVYRCFLENQPMHRLKRVYLLGTLLLSLVVPVMSIRVPSGWVLPSLSTQLVDDQLPAAAWRGGKEEGSELQMAVKTNAPAVEEPALNIPAPYWLWLYGAITTLMLARFARNLYLLIRQIWVNPTEPLYGAMLVKLPGNGLPYTFLHYLFVSATAYDRGQIEEELVDHELAHIRQRHSLDVLLVEIVLCFGWFNPLVFWLKRAMQRNHEFLADEAVNETYLNVPGYQQLLLSKVALAPPSLSLTSTLTFQTTKQRLLMMTKQTSPARTWLAGWGTALLFAALTLLLAGTAPAQQTPTVPAPKMSSEQLPLTEQQLLEKELTVAEIERRFGNKPVNMDPEERRVGDKKEVLFKDLTPEQKTRVAYLAPNSRKTPTEAEWAAFKNPKKYGVWVDSKRRRDNPLSKYKRTDIVTYWSSFVYKNARQPEGYSHQLELYTEAGYQKTLQRSRDHPFLLLATKERWERRRQRMSTAR